MKIRNLLILTSLVVLISGCVANNNTPASSEDQPSQSSETSSASSSEASSSKPSSTTPSSSTSQGPTKVTVPAHTLSDSNPPINPSAKGERVSETTWNSFKNASASKFNGNYNLTYKAYSGGVLQMQYFTKNGYYMQSSSGRLYYERKSGSTFYQYIDVSDGWRRTETTLNIQSKYTSIFTEEIYVHMFEFSKYDYDEDEGEYMYIDYGFGSTVKFQGGYLTHLYYGNGSSVFEIYASFETTINIPQSYYYS